MWDAGVAGGHFTPYTTIAVLTGFLICETMETHSTFRMVDLVTDVIIFSSMALDY